MKKIVSLLIVMMLFTGLAYAADLDTFQGKWDAVYAVRDGEQLDLSTAGSAFSMEIQGTLVTVYNEGMGSRQVADEFQYEDGVLIFSNDEGELRIEYRDDEDSLFMGEIKEDYSYGFLFQRSYDKEILFRDTPWGISFTEATSLLPELGLRSYNSGYSIESIISDNYYAKQFEYTDIGIKGSAYNDRMNIAGYQTTDIELYFAYLPTNGKLDRKDGNTALYAAKYVFEPVDVNAVEADLKNKLTSLYGAIDASDSDSGIFDNTIWYIWRGADNTGVAMSVLKSTTENWDDKIWLTYYKSDGDDWLQNASDAIKSELISKEQEAAANGGTSGL